MKALLLVTSVPLLFLGKAAAEAGGVLASDLRDQWSFPEHRTEQIELITLIRRWKEGVPGREVAVLGGDVHVGAHTRLEMEDGSGRFTPVFDQYITSPMTNEPPSALAFFGLKTLLLDRHHEVTDRIRYRHLNLTRKRNYAVLTLRAPDTGRASILGSLAEDAND